VTFFRSSAKPLQAIPLVEEGVLERFGITEEELACGPHTSDDTTALEKLIRPPITNTRGEDSGEIRADFQLEWVT